MVPADEDDADKSDNCGGAAQHSAPHGVAAAGVGSLARLVREVDLETSGTNYCQLSYLEHQRQTFRRRGFLPTRYFSWKTNSMAKYGRFLSTHFFRNLRKINSIRGIHFLLLKFR